LERGARVSVAPGNGLDERMKTALRALASGLVLDELVPAITRLSPPMDAALIDVLERLAATLMDRGSILPTGLSSEGRAVEPQTIDAHTIDARTIVARTIDPRTIDPRQAEPIDERALEAEETATQRRLDQCRVELETARGDDLEVQRAVLIAQAERLGGLLRERRRTMDGLEKQSRSARRRAVRLSAALADAHSAASTDPLTGLGNRRALDRAVEGLAGRDTSVAVLMLDLDRFKSINDDHGHSVGDRVLLHVAETLQAALRGDDLGFRIGGEEFVVLLFDCDGGGAARTAERLRLRIEQRPLALASGTLSVTASLGVSDWNPSHGAGATSFVHALERADAALYQAKREGRNRWVARPA
jgi:diguanylate cyclase (GGDEF)-like protein